VSRDLSYLNKQARDNLKFHVQERLPEQYQKCCNGLTQVLKMAWNIVLLDSTNNNNQTTRVQALSLINDCYKYQMDLTTGSAIITDAVKMVTQKTEQLDTLKKLDEKIEGIEEETTTNGVF
jgi:transketolase